MNEKIKPKKTEWEMELQYRKKNKTFKYVDPAEHVWFQAEVSYYSAGIFSGYQINCSATGTNSPKVTRRMAEVTLKAVKYANDLNEKLGIN